MVDAPEGTIQQDSRLRSVLTRINTRLDTLHHTTKQGKGAVISGASIVTAAALPAAVKAIVPDAIPPEILSAYTNILGPLTGAFIGLTFEPVTRLIMALQRQEYTDQRPINYTPLKDVLGGALGMGALVAGADMALGPEVAGLVSGADDVLPVVTGIVAVAKQKLAEKR